MRLPNSDAAVAVALAFAAASVSTALSGCGAEPTDPVTTEPVTTEPPPPAKRTFGAWVQYPMAADAATQLRNASWAGVFDGVHAVCGAGWVVSDGVAEIQVNETIWQECADLYKATREHGARFTVLLGGVAGETPMQVPPEALANPQSVVKSAIELASRLQIDGFNIDDESECAPRADLANFSTWAAFINTFAEGLHEANLTLTADVQAVFGIVNGPYEYQSPCKLGPWQYEVDPGVLELMSNSSVDAWIEMDTYYFGLSRYLDALDWYSNGVPHSKLGIGIMNRDDIEEPDGYVARFHALEQSGVNELHLWRMPVADVWLPYIQRWKSQCAGCPQLSCYELSVECSPSTDVIAFL